MSAWNDYFGALVELHISVGRPSSRELATRAGSNRTTVNEVMRGARLPTWELLHKILTGLGADQDTEDRFNNLWVAAYREVNVNSAQAPAPVVPTGNSILGELRAIRDLLEDLVELHRREG